MVSKRSKRRVQWKPQPPQQQAAASSTYRPWFDRIYDEKYLSLLWISVLLAVLSIGFLLFKFATTGELIDAGVSLKGGITITVTTTGTPVAVSDVERLLQERLPQNDLVVREIAEFGVQQAVTIETAPIVGQKVEDLEPLVLSVLESLVPDARENYSVETVGSSLGKSFLTQSLIALLAAFVFMSIVVFIAFRTFVPSMAVILCVMVDLIETFAAVSFIGLKLSTAGIAAFLMLVGYSVDTDILLSTRVLKRKEGSVYSRIKSAVGTGLMMNATTFAAALVGFLVTQSSVIKEIMIILLFGIVFDIINTWIQNAAILRWYAEKKRL